MLLVFSSRYSDDARLLGEAARLCGWQTVKLRPSEVTSDLSQQECRVYAEGFFAEHVAAQAGLQLLRPADDILASLEPRFLQRQVQSFRAETFQRPTTRSFIKPADQKFFAAGVYEPDEVIPGLELLLPTDPILVSEVVNFTREYRFFVKDQTILTGSIYLVDGEVPKVAVAYEGEGDEHWQTAKAFAHEVCTLTPDLPASFVIDVGLLEAGSWAVIEFNPTWASGIYGSDPNKVLEALEASQISL